MNRAKDINMPSAYTLTRKTDMKKMSREEKARLISPRRVGLLRWLVPSQSVKGREYVVTLWRGGLTCSCPDRIYRHTTCKHILSVKRRSMLAKFLPVKEVRV
jgi:predicted nucleic acid-binding Zn finger protein